MGGLDLRLLHALLVNRRANGAVSVTPNAALIRALQAGPADRDTSLVSRIIDVSYFPFGIPVCQPLDRNVAFLYAYANNVFAHTCCGGPPDDEPENVRVI